MSYGLVTLIKWTTPKVVRRHKWNTSGKREMLLVVRLSLKWTLLLGVPILCAAAHFAPQEAHRVALRLLIVPIMLLLQIVPHLALHQLTGAEYRLDGKGLCRSGGGSSYRILWRQIHSWAIDDHPRIAGIRVLTLKVTVLRHARTRHFPFNPHTTNEAALRALLRANVHPNC